MVRAVVDYYCSLYEAGSWDAASMGTLRNNMLLCFNALDMPLFTIVTLLIFLDRARLHGVVLTRENRVMWLFGAITLALKVARRDRAEIAPMCACLRPRERDTVQVTFDDPVWNDDVLRLMPSLPPDLNFSVRQLSEWEAKLLRTIEFDTSVSMSSYGALLRKLVDLQQTVEVPAAHHGGGELGVSAAAPPVIDTWESGFQRPCPERGF